MNSFLKSAGYLNDAKANVWLREGYESIAYSDGVEIEQRIGNIVACASDVSVLSSELRRHCTDWPTTYHLSSARANLLRPFEGDLKGADVLEIGAGCGAISRYLGEAGANVLALEGSRVRAAIARSRTRDLENVTVLSEKFDQFQCDHKFDVVTLIGVLEYANLFVASAAPHLAMLAQAKALLKPNGRLILAIENQLGLKYFAGANEDHLGKPMYGIEGRYTRGEPQTFGKRVLDDLLREAGFDSRKFFAPFPDYKLPVSIVTERGIAHAGFDAAALAWQGVNRDLQLPRHPLFSQELAWSEIFENGLGIDMANSFLIISSPSPNTVMEDAVLGYHYSTERVPQFCKEVRFLFADNKISVESRPLAPLEIDPCAQQEDGRSILFRPPLSQPYLSGQLLSHRLLEILNRPGWSIGDVSALADRYLSAIRRLAEPDETLKAEGSSAGMVPGHFFDALFQNIIEREDGTFGLFDCEWVLTEGLSVEFLLFRSLFVSLGGIEKCSRPDDLALLKWKYLIQHVAARCELEISDSLYISFLSKELEFRRSVTGLVSGTVDVLLEYELRVVDPDGLDATLLSPDAASQGQRIAVTHYKAAIAERDEALARRDEALARRDEAQLLVDTLLDSTSWRVTKPLRFAARTVRNRGIAAEDTAMLRVALRDRYHRLPLPPAVKKYLGLAYRRGVRRLWLRINRASINRGNRQPPSFTPVMQDWSKPDYIIFGVIDWHFRHQRPQQLAQALAATGRRVLYVSPNLIDDVQPGFHAEALNGIASIVQVQLFVHKAPSIYADAPSAETVSQMKASLGRVLDWADSISSVSLVQHPFWHQVATTVPNSRLIYDCMDHHEGFGNNSASLLELERNLTRDSELTITTSDWLDKAVAPYTQRRAIVRNAGDYDHFATVPSDVYRDPQGRRVIGYYGAIAEWFDIELVKKVALQNMQSSVVLVGADTVNARQQLSKFPNITFVGEVPYDRLPYYLYGFDVCLLPFQVIPLTLATNPVKAYEYLSAGKPVVTVDLPEMSQFTNLVYRAQNHEEFLSLINVALSETATDPLVVQRKAFARAQTWVHRAEAMVGAIETGSQDPKVSVVVVTYNNIELTQVCLSSLTEASQYDNLEIIVVDNASQDGSPAYLTQWAGEAANRKLILNPDNRGFAAANNQGLAVASGKYMVLLNNDTFVTPGWVRTLISHMRRDPSIGIIGPVTNNIGNEAKIDIAYRDMNEMRSVSSSYLRAHMGDEHPLRTAAFFCVMFSRETFQAVGFLDEAFGRGFFEDDDYCRRVEQLGKRIVCAEDVFIHHHLSASFNKLKAEERARLFEENKAIYEQKWGKWSPHSYR